MVHRDIGDVLLIRLRILRPENAGGSKNLVGKMQLALFDEGKMATAVTGLLRLVMRNRLDMLTGPRSFAFPS
jgi:hypothetical protein